MSNNDRIFPDWNTINNFHDSLTEGERNLAVFLDKNLPEGWKIYVQPYLNGKRPDIVIMHPKIGVRIFEVKDYALKTYKHNKSTTKAHVQQVKNYKEKIIKQLLPNMGEEIDSNVNNYGLIKLTIYQEKIKGDEARELFGKQEHISIIGFDDLYKNNMDLIEYRSKFDKGYMREEWAHELEFWLNPPFHSIDQAKPLELNKNQKENTIPKPGHRRLRGAAGSGKTIVLAYKAARLASEGHKVLVITFNQTLWHYIKDVISCAPFEFEWKYINFYHLHGFCNNILEELNVPKPRENYFDQIVPTLEEAIENNNIDKFKYDAILIDEGQDYEWSWYNLLSKFLTERDELFFVCDKKQNLYDRDLSWIEDMGSFKGKVKFRGRWAELNSVYRMPKQIGDLALKFSEKFGLEQSIDSIEDYQQLTLYERPPIVEWININPKSWLQNVMESYDKIKYNQMNLGEGHASDIVILLPSIENGMRAVREFKSQNIDINHVFDPDKKNGPGRNKKSFWMGDSRLKISTIHSFKGWESLHVILVIPASWGGKENLNSLVYTAMTRSKKNLIVLNCNNNYWEFGEDFEEKEELLEEIESNFDPEIESEIETWADSIPYPLASILWESIISSSYEHKVKYLLHFFEAFSLFNFNLMLSGLSRGEELYNKELSFCLQKASDFKNEWYYEPSFGNWNTLSHCLASLLGKNMKNQYERGNCVHQFGKPSKEFLNRISNMELIYIFKKVAKYRNLWEGHGPRVSEEEHQKRFEILINLVNDIRKIILDSFENTFLVIPLSNTFNEGKYHYSAKKLSGTNPRFRPISLKTEMPLDKDKIYLFTKNKTKALELLPLIKFNEETCYFYNGKDFNSAKARYSSYHNDKEPEIQVPSYVLSELFNLLQQ